MEDFVGFSSRRSSVDDENNSSSDRACAASPDGYTSAGNGNRMFTDKRRHCRSDPEHKKRRVIANNNERKRMQSINEGFSSLRNLVCPKSADKLSKAAILKYTADLIKTLLTEKQQLLADNHYLEQLFGGTDLDIERHSRHLVLSQCSPPRPGKRRWREAESSSSDEGISFTTAEEILVTSSSNISNSSSQSISELQRQIKELQEEVEKEKTLRQFMEADKKQLENLKLQQPSLPSQQTSLMLTAETSSTKQTSTVIQLPDLHNRAWRRGLETIVEAIRHVEGEQGMFCSGDITHPLQQTSLNNNTTGSQLKTAGSFESSSSLLSQLHPVCIRDLSLANQICFSPSFHHRSSLASPSS